MFYAHWDKEDGRRELLLDHLEATAKYAQAFAAFFGAGEAAFQVAMGHDVGKYSTDFQKRLLEGAKKVDHSTAGAIEINKSVGFMYAYCAAGHHGGLPDGGIKNNTEDEATLWGRLKRTPPRIPDYSAFASEVPLSKAPPIPVSLLGRGGFSRAFFIRMLFSCLVDADFLSTEAFMKKGVAARGAFDCIEVLEQRLAAYTKRFFPPEGALNEMRCRILAQCGEAALSQRGLFTLTVPTGGGKTISSLAFALRHAKERGLRRVIYVIPYTTIIEQT